MRRVFGLEPHTSIENIYRHTAYRDREIDATVGVMLYDLHGIKLKFLAHRTTGNIWHDFLDTHGEGLHHIRFEIDDHAAVRETCTPEASTPTRRANRCAVVVSATPTTTPSRSSAS
jgi:catechol 2,3-dioxygenase-like lactoylglutathione lyase family enzyme